MSERSASSIGSGRGRSRFGVGLTMGALAGFALVRRLSAPRRMPHLARWQRELAEKRGEAEAARLLARTQSRFNALYAQRPRPAKRALRLHLRYGVLPGLALYQALLEENGDQEAALAEMADLSLPSLGGLRRLMPLLGRLPVPFAVFRRLELWVIRFGFPPEGWELEPVEDSEDCFAFNMRRCFYLDTLTSYGAPELTPHYCGRDDVLFAMLPPSITWERTMTLGGGRDRCNFRWCRAMPEGTIPGAGERWPPRRSPGP